MDRICTIIALNYLPQAMALLQSTREIYPNGEFFVLIIDASTHEQSQLAEATVLLPEDLEIPSDWLAEMKTYYDQVELATSLKPFLLQTLLTEGVSTVTFLDPDILLFSELTEGINAAKDSGIALVPHRLTPSDINSTGYSELAFLQYGIFNLGYISIGQKGKPMLEWWGERLHWYCTRFPSGEVFTDQKWMNFVPALFDFRTIRNPGYDFAPWNINERHLREIDGTLHANDSPMVFIHFSQMSGLLAAGRKTDLWEKGLSSSIEDSNSLTLISKLTNDYSKMLVSFGEHIKADTPAAPKSRTNPPLSFHRRQQMILESIDNARKGNQKNAIPISPNPYPGPVRKMIKTLESSATLNGLRKGLRTDLPKVAQRLRSFFQR